MSLVPQAYRQSFLPYILLGRFDRPIGIWLLALPGLWSIWLASGGFSFKAVWLSILFLIGAVAMRAAGCVVNDIWDRDLDRKVERTSVRPLAAKDLSLKQAMKFLIALLLVGLFVLVQMNGMTIVLGLLSLPLVIAYPLMKRITFWPQAFLGLTFNFGALMGWSAMQGNLGIAALFLYVGAIFWTLGYDTIYAHQDIEDDMMAGIKSTALKFGDTSKIWVAAFYGFAFCFMAVSFYMVVHSAWALVCVIPVAAHFVYQMKSWELYDVHSALMVFKSNRDCGFLILVAAILAGLF